MTTKREPLPAEPKHSAVNEGVAADLNDEAIRNLTGFFDVLIQMDFAQKQRNKRSDEVDNDLPNNTKVST